MKMFVTIFVLMKVGQGIICDYSLKRIMTITDNYNHCKTRLKKLHYLKCDNFTKFPVVEILWKSTVSFQELCLSTKFPHEEIR